MAGIVMVSCADLADRIEQLQRVYSAGGDPVVDPSKTFVFNVIRGSGCEWIDQESASESVLRPFLGSEHCEKFIDQVKPADSDPLDRLDHRPDACRERVGGVGDEPTTSRKDS